MTRLGPLSAVAVLGGIGLLMVSPIVDPDLWWLLRAGRYIIETRSFPTTDPFSASAAGAEWVNHAWGFELILYGVYRLAGTTGLIVMQALFAVATFGLLYGHLRREQVGRGWALAAVALGALATRGFWVPRPQLVTYLFLALFWVILRESRDGRRDRLLWLVPLMVVWVNLHGGFAIGPALLGLCLVAELFQWAFRGDGPAPDGRRLARLASVGVGCGLATLVNPFHYRAVLFPFQVLGDHVARDMIAEWASLPFHHPQAMLLEGLILLTLVLLLRTPRPVPWGDLLVLVVFVHLALQAIRNTPLFVILLVPILGRLLAEAGAGVTPALVALGDGIRRRWGAASTAIVAVAIVPAMAWWTLPVRGLEEFRPQLGLAADVFPARAVEFLKREPRTGAMFNDYYWGGYLIWHLYPQYRVSIDGRAAVYGPRGLAAHAEIDEVGPRWRQTLDRSGVGLALIRTHSPLARALRASPDWEVLYEDQLAIILAKQGKGP